mmetsp:Transcript_58330/g.163430  ORF Transcript_58330/g.163430 Transcript_58330/m.163430 type:complete len:209 (+) Transcript_58330:92-718(+)
MTSAAPQGSVIGTAAQDPKIQAALQAHVAPRLQQAAWNRGSATAADTVQSGAAFVKREFVEVRTYIQESHCSLRILCFCNALALCVSSILGLINVFSAAFRPFQYVLAVYNLLFAVVIVVIDGKPGWFRRCGDVQVKLYRAVPVLASQVGRALFYFYVGSINIVMLPENWFWKMLYIFIGMSLCFAGAATLAHNCYGRFQEHPTTQGP